MMDRRGFLGLLTAATAHFAISPAEVTAEQLVEVSDGAASMADVEAAMRLYLPGVVDQLFKNGPLLAYLRKKGIS